MDLIKDKKLVNWLTLLALFAIILFSLFLRYEDFPAWKKYKQLFTYEGEYQMATPDGYYFLQLAKDMVNGTYTPKDEKRYFPQGEKRPFIPPLLSSLVYIAKKVFAIPMATSAIFLPIFLAALLIPMVYAMARLYQLHRLPALVAAFFSMISLTYIVRTRIGVYDTDCLNATLLLLNAYLMMRFIFTNEKSRYWFFGLLLLTTFIFYMTWDNAQSVVLLSFTYLLALGTFFYFKNKQLWFKILIAAMLFLPLVILFGHNLLELAKLSFGIGAQHFPRVTIAEHKPVNLQEFIEQTAGHIVLFMPMLVGLIYFFQRRYLKQTLFLAIPFILAFVAFFGGNRFLLFAAPILGLGMGASVHVIYNLKTKFNPYLTYGLTIVLVGLCLYFNYHTITYKWAKPAAFDHLKLLKAIKNSTPPDSIIWADSILGYQIRYYLDRGTFCDVDFDGRDDVSYYTCLPFTEEKPAFAANFIHFYAFNYQAMNTIREVFPHFPDSMVFLKEVLSHPPDRALNIIQKKLQNNSFPKNQDLVTTQDWLNFLYPKPTKEIYLVLNHHMLDPVPWFERGNVDLHTLKIQGLPLYLQFHQLEEEGELIKNNAIVINTRTGWSLSKERAKQQFAHILTVEEDRVDIKHYAAIKRLFDDKRFVFQWNKKLGFGAALSQQMAKTNFNQLFLQHKQSKYFIPVDLKTPYYQIWKVNGDVYEK